MGFAPGRFIKLSLNKVVSAKGVSIMKIANIFNGLFDSTRNINNANVLNRAVLGKGMKRYPKIMQDKTNTIISPCKKCFDIKRIDCILY